MKKIELPTSIKFRFGKSKVILLNKVSDDIEKRKDRGAKIISASITVESVIDDGNYIIRYFDQKPMRKILDDKYWDTLSKSFMKPYNILLELLKKLQKNPV